MNTVELGPILYGISWQSNLCEKWEAERAFKKDRVQRYEAGGLERRIDETRKFLNCAEKAGLDITAKNLSDLLGVLERAPKVENDDRILSGPDLEAAIHYLSQVVSIVPDESQTKLFFVVSSGTKALLAPTTPRFGEQVDNVFPIAVDDIIDAGRCLALGQGTASVFHLMRVMEAGFRGVAAELGVSYAPSWESYERKLKNILDPANYKSLSADQNAKRSFYDAVLSDLNTVKMVWRNPTMHIVKTYDAEQAKLIYAAVENFMRRIAEKLNPIAAAVISTGPTSP
jgi:hypothetical protein